MTLSPRLQQLRNHYHQHESIWDIGCDHGLLGLSFSNEEGVKGIHLVDPSQEVMGQLEKAVDSHIPVPDLKITLHHKMGQEIILGSESKLIFIAGMGGKEIEHIADHLRPQLGPRDDLVISPHRDILALRDWLSRGPFFLERESLVLDRGRFYQILSLSLREGRRVHPFGEEIFEGELGREYRNHQLGTFSAHKDVHSAAYVNFLNRLTQCF